MATTRKTPAAKPKAKPAKKTAVKPASPKGKSPKSKRCAPKPKPARVTAPVEEITPTVEEAKPFGRPSTYTAEIAAEICGRIAEGETLRQIAEDEHMPTKRTILLWVTNPKPDNDFFHQYVRAREAACVNMADELVEISDDGSNDWMEREGKDGSSGWAVNGEHISRSKLRTDTRKWLMAKAMPKVYGDKVVTEHVGKDGGAIQIDGTTNDMEVARRVAFALGRALTKHRVEDAQVIDAS